MSGYVRIHRSLLGHPAFRNEAETMAFAWLVCRASWKPARLRYKGRAVELDRGQVAISVRDFAEAMDRDKAWIERLLKRLRRETMIASSDETGVNVITICNYNEYQPAKSTGETVDETPRETDARQTRDTEQVREEVKKEEEEEASPLCRADQPVDEAVAIWSEAAAHHGWKPLNPKLNASRKAQLSARLREEGLDGWRAAIQRACRSERLGGPDPPGWFNFAFIIKSENFLKLTEGNYDRDFSSVPASRPSSWGAARDHNRVQPLRDAPLLEQHSGIGRA